MSDNLLDETLKRYFDTKLKFNYFILSTTLAILGLSLQVIKPSHTDIYPLLVFMSWGLLLLSLIAGFTWHISWIEHHSATHSGLLNLKSNEDIQITKKDRSIITRMVVSEIFQLFCLVTGIILLGVYKIVNFYS